MNSISRLKNKFVFSIALLFVYVAFFEFILPVNRILPKPSVLLESFFTIWQDYNLIQAMAITSTAVYISIGIGFAILSWLSTFIIKLALEYRESLETLKIFRFFPAFFFAIVFIYWFQDSFIAEIFFGLFTFLIFISNECINNAKKVNQEYLLIGRNLELTDNQIYSKIVWKTLLPSLTKSLLRLHYYLWIIVMIYEFVGGISGFGGVYKLALNYSDFTALFTIAIVISILILIGDFIIKYITDKLVFWD